MVWGYDWWLWLWLRVMINGWMDVCSAYVGLCSGVGVVGVWVVVVGAGADVSVKDGFRVLQRGCGWHEPICIVITDEYIM